MSSKGPAVPAKVALAKWTQSPSSGNWGILLDFEFVNPEKDYLGNGTPSLEHVIWITERNAHGAAKALKTLGFDVDSASSERRAQFRTDPMPFLLNAECVLACTLEAPNEYHKDSRWKVKWINPVGGSKTEEHDPLQVLLRRPRKDDDQRSLLMDSRESKPTQYDDDVPF